MSALIAIVGRPNVGKSALFNRIVGRRIAIVHDQPGVTRDRISAEAEWRGRRFTLVDTGGIGLAPGEKAPDALAAAALAQVHLAIEAAAVIVWVVDAQEGVMPLDEEVAARLRRSGKTVLVAANKADNPKIELNTAEFARWGFEPVFPVSALHGRGVDNLVEAALNLLPETATAPGEVSPSESGEAQPLKLAIVGRPNVGKSSLLNALIRSERVLVSPTPGTTRDAVDVPFELETEGRREHYVLIDTAGIRKERRAADSIEFFSIKRAEAAIARCDIALLVLDAEAGITEQDKKIAAKITGEHKACIIVVNKWDLMADAVRAAQEQERARRKPGGPRRMTRLAEFGAWVQEKLFFLDYAPVIFTSATTGFHLDRLLEAVRYVATQLQQEVPTALLNRTLHEAVERRQPISATGQRLKFFYATQIRRAPHTFVLFVNRDELFSPAYAKYLTGALRRAFGFEGCPIVLRPRPRPQPVPPVRRAAPPSRPRRIKPR